ncbi:tetraacyldisaccharide 4'-kinase, partial [Chlamydia psittaci 06-1683]
KIARGRFYHS